MTNLPPRLRPTRMGRGPTAPPPVVSTQVGFAAILGATATGARPAEPAVLSRLHGQSAQPAAATAATRAAIAASTGLPSSPLSPPWSVASVAISATRARRARARSRRRTFARSTAATRRPRSPSATCRRVRAPFSLRRAASRRCKFAQLTNVSVLSVRADGDTAQVAIQYQLLRASPAVVNDTVSLNRQGHGWRLAATAVDHARSEPAAAHRLTMAGAPVPTQRCCSSPARCRSAPIRRISMSADPVVHLQRSDVR